jgi:hypothetical protein
VVYDPAERAFDHPPSFDHIEPFGLWVFRDDLDVGAEGRELWGR